MSEATVHASCVAIAGRAVLISGPSGAGKSDLTLRLIDRGATLVSDDYTRLRTKGGQLLANPPAEIAGKVEMRGVGIVVRPFASEVAVALLVDLAATPERLPEPAPTMLCGLPIPTIALNALEPSAPIKVEAALALHGLPSSCPL